MIRKSSILILVAGGAAIAQEDATTRQLWNKEFMDKRPQATAPKTNNVRYRPVGPKAVSNTAPAGQGTMIGLTLWKLRLATSTDPEGTRLFVVPHPGEDKVAEVPERVDPNQDLAPGHYRLTVEVPTSGYLYVIDRERYQDGKTSPPFVIYPNWQTRQGDNVVAPGRLIEIPDRREQVSFFELRPNQGRQGVEVAELLSLVIAPEPLDLKIGHDPVQLDETVYATWAKKWGVKAEQFELDGAEGKAWTEKENKAGARSVTLTQDDALPQTLYRLNVKPGTGVLVEVPLKLKQ
jgi:hypothetical protein